jgi:alpha-galactosidase
MKSQSLAVKAASCLLLLGLALAGSRAAVSQAGAGPSAENSPWIIAKILGRVPFSFVYGGKPSGELLPQWERKQVKQDLPGDREHDLITYRDRSTGLEVIYELTLYKKLRAVDWVVRLRNGGAADTPIIEDLRSLDLGVDVPGRGDVVLHQAGGGLASPGNLSAEDFLLKEDKVGPGRKFQMVHYVTKDGKVSGGGEIPYFDLQWPEGGLIGAVGWSGQWEIQVSRELGRRITLQAGQQDVHLKLHPGESIRTPSTVLVQWSGPDRDTGHNMFRRLLVAYYLPRIAGQVAMPPVSATTAYVLLFDAIAKKTGKNPLDVLPTLTQDDLSPKHGMPTSDDALNAVDEQSQLDYIRKMPPVGMEAFWLDAGWFPGGWPYGAGNWYPDPKKFPHGMKPIGDAAHQKGMKFLLWFEPGRVAPGTLIATQHPDWILHTANDGKAGGRFYYGTPQARQWMTDLLSKCIDDWGIDIYRQDNNIFPLFFWRAADSPDRRGVTENHDIEGMYAIWDELLRRHPKLEIDNANWQITGPDLETVKRSIGSLTRSEMSGAGIPDPMSDQLESADLNLWIPLHANLLHGLTPYSFQSTASTGVGFGLDLRSNYIPRDQLKLEIERVKELRPFWLGDYYPLTTLEFDQSKWCGWQFDRPDLSAGYAIFFRRPKSSASTFDAGLKGLDPSTSYEVSFSEAYDVKEKRVMTGAALRNLRVEIGSAPGVMLVRYRKKL